MTGIRSFVTPKPIKLIKMGYILGLSLIAGMSVGAHFVADNVINQSEHSATTINVAGKQQTLSQRTVYFLVKANQTRNATDLAYFKEALDEFIKNHNGLLHGDESLGLPGEYPSSVADIYFKGEYPLDNQMQRHLAALKKYYTRIKSGEVLSVTELEPLLANAEIFLFRQLKNVVSAHENTADEKIDYLMIIQRYSIVAILLALLAEAFIIFNPLVRRLQKHSERLEYVANHDELTGILNRRAFYNIAENEIENSDTSNTKLSVLLLDLDHFKAVNDTHGHKVGDDVLVHFSHTCSRMLRKDDVFARIGGEEFAVLLRNTDTNAASIVAEKLGKAIKNNPIELANGEMLPVTTSIGITEANVSEVPEELDQILVRADEALYLAKSAGRDRYEIKIPIVDAPSMVTPLPQKIAQPVNA